MTDSFANPVFGDHEEPRAQVEGTGDVEVDAALVSLRDLEDTPVSEHVAVFERAHETLRRTLAGAGQGRLQDPAAGRG